MKFYDFPKAIRLINQHKPKTATLGLREDWSWTADDVYKDGEYLRGFFTGDIVQRHDDYRKDLEEELKKAKDGKGRLSIRMDINKKYEDILVQGLVGSIWATPSLLLEFEDGTEVIHTVAIGESEGKRPDGFMFGEISGPCQEAVNNIKIVE